MSAVILAAIAACISIMIPAIVAGVTLAATGNAMSGAISERPEVFTKVVISVVFAEALAIYGLLISFLIINQIATIQQTLALQYDPIFIGTNNATRVAEYVQALAADQGGIALFAGLTICGGTVGAGIGIAVTGSSVTAVVTENPDLFTKGIISVVFSEALAIYGLLISFLLINQIVAPGSAPIFPT
ncbi:MAG: hypothetical protein ACTSUV_04745 [Candidatus Ranarchaeia archaeon]